MKMVYEILLESALYLAFILVMGAFFYSALILFKPKAALNIPKQVRFAKNFFL